MLLKVINREVPSKERLIVPEGLSTKNLLSV
jgi:hypothetical protein